jgi:hypothetical protein
LPEGTRRTVGEAALCAKADYEHLLVERRIELLAEAGITRDMFRYHRDEAFRQIITYLTHRPPAKVKQAVAPYKGRRQLTEDERLVRNLVNFAQCAMDLHYAGLTVLFSQDLAYFLNRNNILPHQVIAGHRRIDPLDDSIFARYINLLYRSGYASLEEYLQSECHGVISLYEKIGDATPIGPRTVPGDETPSGSFSTPEEKLLYRLGLAELAYRSHWRPWYSANCIVHGSRANALVPIVAASGTIEYLLARHFGLNTIPQVHEKARLIAHKTLASYYNQIDERAPLAGSLSLRHRADAYFDVQGALLTNRGRKWYRGQIDKV